MKVRTLVAIAVALPLLGVGAVLLPGRVDERWDAMVAWARQAERQWRERDFRREPAWGTATSGEAFAAYAEAVGRASTRDAADKRQLEDLRRRTEVDATTAMDFAVRWRGALQALSDGAHRDDARPPIDWQKGSQQKPAQLVAGRDLLAAAAIEARRRVGAGQGRAAVELVLDAATYAVDLQHSPLLVDQLIACALLQGATGEALRDEDLRRLDADALALLASGLECLDRRVPTELDVRGEALLLAHSLMRGAPPPSEAPPPGGYGRSWRYAWSQRWAASEAVLALVELQDALVAHAGKPWPQRAERLRELVAGVLARGNGWLEMSAGTFVTAERALRQSLAQLRLLRLCVAFHTGAELPVLADPLADGPLQVERKGDGATFAAGTTGPGERRLERTAAPR